MGLNAAALPIIWVAAGGRKDLTASLVGTLVLLWISQMLAVYGSQYALVLMGAILLLAVMVAPNGFVLALANRLSKPRHRQPPRKQPTAAREQAAAGIKS
jgi:ABC-type branched-subunit amino acid transport system permease subunit